MTLAFGISLNVKTGLGVSPIISVANCFSSLLSLPIGDTTFVLYSVFVIIQIIVHIHLSRKNSEIQLRSLIIKDILQLPLSLVFTRIRNVFEIMIPQMNTLRDGFFSSMPGRLVALAAAIIATGVGAAATLDMRLIPNPGDGIVQSLSDLSKKGNRICKECLRRNKRIAYSNHIIDCGREYNRYRSRHYNSISGSWKSHSGFQSFPSSVFKETCMRSFQQGC